MHGHKEVDRSIHHNNFKPLRVFRRALSREIALGTGSLVGAEAVHLPRESPILPRDPWCGRKSRVHGALLIGFPGGEFLRLVACYSFKLIARLGGYSKPPTPSKIILRDRSGRDPFLHWERR